MSNKFVLPAWGEITGLKGNEVFFESKQNDRGSFMYRKLIPNKRHTIVVDGGDPVHALKASGQWLHEDDFGTQWISNPKRKNEPNVAVVELDGPLISRAIDVFDRKVGRWRGR
jgi:hypothetical protein